MSEISYLPTFIIITGILGFPYGFKIFCESYIKIKKLESYFIVMLAKIKCNLIKGKSFIKLQFIKEYHYIRSKIWVNRYYRKQISISIKKGEIEIAKELKNLLSSINKLEREKFIEFVDKLIQLLSETLSE